MNYFSYLCRKFQTMTTDKDFGKFLEEMDSQHKIAMELIREYHTGQTDLSGRPYIEHLERVRDKVDDLSARRERGYFMENESVFIKAEIAALLHDILEDTECTEDILKEKGIEDEIISAVKTLTHSPEMSYFAYILLVEKNPIAKIVKMCDLEDNMDIRRLKTMSDGSIRRLKKYWAAWKYLNKEINAEKARTIIETNK